VYSLYRNLLLGSEEMMQDIAERMSKANNFLYLFFLAPNRELVSTRTH
jgi:hypothetical protein